MNFEKIEQATKLLLEGIGEDPTRQGLIDTPKRVAKMYKEILEGYTLKGDEHLKTRFEVDSTGVLVEKDIQFHSLCEHHLLPFFGKVHVAYLPNNSVVGLSKIPRTVEVFAKRLQLQEQMTTQIAKALMDNLDAKGVMVVSEAEHMCMSMRGVKKPGSTTRHLVTLGEFETNAELRNDTLRLMGL